jgi:hypothetical protein
VAPGVELLRLLLPNQNANTSRDGEGSPNLFDSVKSNLGHENKNSGNDQPNRQQQHADVLREFHLGIPICKSAGVERRRVLSKLVWNKLVEG